MSAYLIYTPSLKLGAEAKFAQCQPLVDLLGTNHNGIDWKETASGPAGPGHVGAFAGTDSHHGVASWQKWSKSPFGDFWIGWDPDRKPSPVDLSRPSMLDGNPVQLNDGREWTVPVATLLPTNLGLDENGKFTRRVKEEYREFFDEAESWFRRYMDLANAGGGEMTFQFDEPFDFACRTLGKNYLLDAFVISELDLLDDSNLMEVVTATFGFVKKN